MHEHSSEALSLQQSIPKMPSRTVCACMYTAAKHCPEYMWSTSVCAGAHVNSCCAARVTTRCSALPLLVHLWVIITFALVDRHHLWETATCALVGQRHLWEMAITCAPVGKRLCGGVYQHFHSLVCSHNALATGCLPLGQLFETSTLLVELL
jgi:hypothetical protein